MKAKGSFEVKINPVEGTQIEKDAGLARMTIDKTFSGDLIGASKGTMLSCKTESTGSMAYIALEQVEGKLGDKSGTFYFSHTASMMKGDASSAVLKIVVVAGSGTEELTGLSGQFAIDIDAKGGHSFVFEYELP